MEDAHEPEEGAPSAPARGENEPASGGSGASMQYQGPPAAAQSLRATPVETTLAFQQTGEQYQGELKLKLWDMQSTVNRLESPIAQPPGTLDNTMFPMLPFLPTGPATSRTNHSDPLPMVPQQSHTAGPYNDLEMIQSDLGGYGQTTVPYMPEPVLGPRAVAHAHAELQRREDDEGG